MKFYVVCIKIKSQEIILVIQKIIVKGNRKMDMNEVICSCVGTTAQDIKDAMKNGATTLEEVQEATNAGTCCGCCIDQIEGIMIAK